MIGRYYTYKCKKYKSIVEEVFTKVKNLINSKKDYKMGFEDFLKKAGKVALEVGKEVGKGMLKTSEEVMELKKELQDAPNSKLEYLVRHGRLKEKIAAGGLLKERGYSTEEIKELQER